MTLNAKWAFRQCPIIRDKSQTICEIQLHTSSPLSKITIQNPNSWIYSRTNPTNHVLKISRLVNRLCLTPWPYCSSLQMHSTNINPLILIKILFFDNFPKSNFWSQPLLLITLPSWFTMFLPHVHTFGLLTHIIIHLVIFV